MQFFYPAKGINFEEYKEIIKTIVMVYKECNVTSFPINCSAILTHYGFKVYTYSELREQNLELFNLCCSYSNDSFKYYNVIGYNEHSYQRRISFSLMHELGHALLKTHSEDMADIFASHILAPRILVHKYKCNTADKIHDFFGVSITAANNVIVDYRDWFNFISFTTRKPLPAEQELANIFFSDQTPPVSRQTVRRSRKRRLTKRQREMDERAAFFQEQRQIYGEEYVFHVLEEQWINRNSF